MRNMRLHVYTPLRLAALLRIVKHGPLALASCRTGGLVLREVAGGLRRMGKPRRQQAARAKSSFRRGIHATRPAVSKPRPLAAMVGTALPAPPVEIDSDDSDAASGLGCGTNANTQAGLLSPGSRGLHSPRQVDG